MSKPTLSPVASQDRIISLDVLRGLAVLGILIMNIQHFSMITAAYINPTAYGDFTGINLWIWIVSHILADSKFMTLFSMLFGAGILLITRKAKEAGRNPAGLHYKRIFWLLIIGLVHAYLIWSGDILVGYAMCAIMVYLFRNVRPGWLLFWGLLCMSVTTMIYVYGGLTIELWPVESYESSLSNWLPSAEDVQREVSGYQGGWLEQMEVRVDSAIFMETFFFLMSTSWHSGGIMLIGMALFKWGFLSAEKSRKVYVTTLLIGLTVGLTLIIYGVIQNFNHKWFHDYSLYFGEQYNYWGSLFMSMAYVSIIMLICKSDHFKRFKHNLSLIGKSALSNYLLQSILCTFIFYGHGLGLYGKAERWQQILITFGIWIILIILTRIWMKRYRFGPAEWAWRSLTYWKRQPVKID